MKTHYTVALSVLAGIAIGASGLHTLHAEATPPVYMIALNEVSDPAAYKNDYLPPAQASIKEYGGSYVAAGLGTPIEGTLPKGRIVVLRWDSMAALKRWRYSPEYTAAHKRGLNYAKFNTIAVPGIAH